MSKLHTLKPSTANKKPSKRLGRGNGSGKGTFSGKGCKGQNARTGGGVRPGFEGGQTPLYRKLPKLKGFKNINRVEYFPLNLSTLEENFEANSDVNAEMLREKRITKKGLPVKLLAKGSLSKALNITVNKASAKAVELVEKAGGKVIVLEQTPEKEA
jgi:large subunit ribosomal protein L15